MRFFRANLVPIGLALCVLTWVPVGLAAESTDSADVSLSSLLWDKTVNVRAGFGYKDNLLLSYYAPERSGFFFSEAELMVLHLPLDRNEFVFMGSFRDVRYFSGQEVDNEQMGMAIAQYRRLFPNDWKAGLSLQYVYINQVLDVSITETNLGSALVLGHSIQALPYVRKELPHGYWVELEPVGTRQLFAAPLDDYWEPGTKFSVGKSYGYRSELSLTYGFTYRMYDDREPWTLDRQIIPGETLQFTQQEVGLRWRHHWDKDRKWQSSTRLSYYVSRDNGSGYFDYSRYQAVQGGRYKTGPWELSAQAKVAYYDFPYQTVSPTDPELRTRLLANLSCRAQLELAKHVRIFADYEHEQTWSNVTLDQYSVNTVSAGVDLEF